MPTKIIIPSTTHEEFGDSIAKLIRLTEIFINISGKDVVLDFSNSRMLNPFYLGGLTCLIHKYSSLGYKFEFLINPNISSYLETIRFPDCYNIKDQNIQLNKYFSKTYIPLIKFPTGALKAREEIRHSILSALSNLLQKQLNLNEVQRSPISYILDEITHNVNDHSGANEGFVFAQYYPSSNYLDLCISDHGKGIYQSYIDSGKHKPIDEIEAINFAISGLSTKDLPESKGFGISTSKSLLIEGLRGKFYIWSGNTAFVQSVEKKGIVNIQNSHFQGTFVALRIPTLIPRDFNIIPFVG